MNSPEQVVERINAQIAEVEGQLDSLEVEKLHLHERLAGLRKLLDPDYEAGHDAGNDHPPAEEDSPARPSTNGDEKRSASAIVRIRDLLAKEGPLQPNQIAEKLDISPLTVGRACRSGNWFEKAPPGHKKCPWQLSREGKSAAQS